MAARDAVTHQDAIAVQSLAQVAAPLPIATPASFLFDQHVVATLPAPWAMTFLPDGRLLVSERPAPGLQINPTAPGALRVVTQGGQVSIPISGLPSNVGVLDVILDPHFAQNHIVYFSYMDRDPSAPRIGRDAADSNVDPVGIAVARGVLDSDAAGGPALIATTVIWHQFPAIVSFPGSGEPGGRLTFSPDGTYLFIAAGDRQEFGPVQGLDNTLGKIIRIYPDGTIPADNPFVGVAGALPEIWSLGHRNPYGLSFTPDGTLWEHEMGPRGGDELNVIRPGLNYGWPNVSYGDNYDGSPIPKPAPGDGFTGSPLWWSPVIAPSGMIHYSGLAFPQWQDDLVISGLQSRGLVIVDPNGTAATEVARIDLGARTRGVIQGPDGSLWVLLDQPDGRLIQLTPRAQVGHDVDFNGDGRDDLWWASDTHQVGAWLGKGTGDFTIRDGGALRTIPAGWHVVGRGDFDGDGKGDLLWRSDAGAISSWTGTATGDFLIHDGLALRQVPTDWIVVGTADFNGDGRADILWRNVNGTVSNWLGAADGGFIINDSAALRFGPTDWHVVATGDFNGDGRDDILWRHNSGSITTWSGTATGGFVVNDIAGLPFGPIDWQVLGAGDFNGDGRADILWRSADGTIADWLGRTDGGFTVNPASIITVSNQWQIVAIGDYNGDHRDDILWRSNQGTVADWLGKADGSFSPNDANLFLAIGHEWHVQSAVTLF